MQYKIIPSKRKDFHVSKYIHSVFFEYFGKVIYDGIWVGKDSEVENIDGIRKDVIDGCRELGLGAMRWPGGCCADHYHWKNGIGQFTMGSSGHRVIWSPVVRCAVYQSPLKLQELAHKREILSYE